MKILMLSVFLFAAGTQVQSINLRYVYDFVVEGNSLLVQVMNATNLSELTYSLSFQCPTNCTERQRSMVTLEVVPDKGFLLKANDDGYKDPLFLILVSIKNKTAGNAILETLHITFVDNDGEVDISMFEGATVEHHVEIDHPQNQPETVYTMNDILDQKFRKNWLLEPFVETFSENEGGKRRMRISHVDDSIIEPARKHVMVMKRMSTCEGIQRYHSHFLVRSIDNDVLGHWSEWGDWSECSRVRPFCTRERKRICTKPSELYNAICPGEPSEKEPCECPFA